MLDAELLQDYRFALVSARSLASRFLSEKRVVHHGKIATLLTVAKEWSLAEGAAFAVLDMLAAEEQHYRFWVDIVEQLTNRVASTADSLSEQDRSRLHSWQQGVSSLEYKRRCLAFESSRGARPDRRWRVLLYAASIATGMDRVLGLDDTQDHVAENPNLAAARNRSEQVLASVARALYFGRGAIEVSDVAEDLDIRMWGHLQRLFALYRGPTKWLRESIANASPVTFSYFGQTKL